MSSENLPQRIEQLLSQSFLIQDPQAKVQVKRNSFGWLQLFVRTKAFERKQAAEREAQVNASLAKLSLSLGEYPFASYHLLTPQEAAEQVRPVLIQMPLWSELLLAPDPEVEFVPDESSEKSQQERKPFVTTFYSFKGGVGRSTALAFVANILATRGYRVVMIDLDLEAPGLSFAHPVDIPDANVCGVLDYIYQRDLTPDEDTPKIEDCIRQVNIPARGELYLIPAGAYDEGYIHRLADLDIHALYQREKNPIHQLLGDVKRSLEPDIILIDARTGFTEMGAVALFDQADLGIICFSPTKQSYAGLEWVVKAASKQRKYTGIPDLRFLLTPMPPVASAQQQEWLGRAADWITENWGVPKDTTVDELYYYVPYNPNITTLDSLFEEVPGAILDSYMPVADVIRASLPERISRPTTGPEVKIADKHQIILGELDFQSPNAQDMDSAAIPSLFQRTGDFPKFLQDRTWLIRGAKGTGKTLLFRLFVEQAENARKLARQYEDLRNVLFIPGHGRENLRSTLLKRESFEDYERAVGPQNWTAFWLNYLLLQLAASLPGLQTLPLDPFLQRVIGRQRRSQEEVLAWMKARTSILARALDELQMIDEWLGQRGQRVWVLYDELDSASSQKDLRRNALDALLEWWLRSGPGLNTISPKILLREDIWAGLNFNNKTHYSSRTILLRWDEENLWRLVLRQALSTSPTFAAIVRQQSAIELAHLDVSLQIDTLRKGLYPLWGEQMGRVKKSFTYNWVQKRISDYQGNRFPRSLILLLQHAVEIEKNTYDKNPYDTVLRPRSLINALPEVSEERVNDVKNEYSEFSEYLDLLAGERSPISGKHLAEIWNVDGARLKELVNGMIAAGILQEYPSRLSLSENDIRYSVAELYLSGLKMTRLGQR
jgi:MinD-like ATPase involved in chromosome partitioning or flagellar assembly